MNGQQTLMDAVVKQWLEAVLHQHPNISKTHPVEATPLAGDAGFRQYFRLNTQPSLLLVCAPKTAGVSESAPYFALLANQLRHYGVPTPKIIACDQTNNLLLIEDFGDQSFLQMLSGDSADSLYNEAFGILLQLQKIPRATLDLVDYDQPLLRRELQLFPEWFVSRLLKVSLTDQENKLLHETFEFLEEQALAQPQVLVHRDYHSRNLMYREGGTPGLIDFQDAVWGPVTYDLVSLLRDCYICWPAKQVKRWMHTYVDLATELGIVPVTSKANWQQWFDCMGLQRHIKVLGVFTRLWLRDGKPGYLKDLPLVWRYTLDIAGQYQQTHAFAVWCEQTLSPAVQQQSWYRPSDTAT